MTALYGVVGACLLLQTVQSSMDCFMRYPGKALYGSNTKVEDGVTIEQCKLLCLAEKGFLCRSFDYAEDKRVCFLSADNADSKATMMGKHATSLYFERMTCPEGECHGDWFAYGGHCYLFAVGEAVSKADAKRNCDTRKSHLVAMETEEEYTFVTSTIGDVQKGPFAQWWTAGHADREGDLLNWAWKFEQSGVDFDIPMELHNWMPQFIRDKVDMNAVLLTAGTTVGMLKVPDTSSYRGRHAYICEKIRDE